MNLARPGAGEEAKRKNKKLGRGSGNCEIGVREAGGAD